MFSSRSNIALRFASRAAVVGPWPLPLTEAIWQTLHRISRKNRGKEGIFFRRSAETRVEMFREQGGRSLTPSDSAH